MQLTLYHGSGSLFEKFEQNKARLANDYYGGGVAYFTDSPEVALGYAVGRSKGEKTTEKVLYTVNLTLKQLFDIDDEFSGPMLQKLTLSDTESFARGAGLLKYGVDKYAILAGLKTGTLTLTGDQVFHGLSNGMINTTKARETLKKNRFDGLRYNGGKITGHVPHNVFLAYQANSIKILDITIEEQKV